jgi:hypothetical protein
LRTRRYGCAGCAVGDGLITVTAGRSPCNRCLLPAVAFSAPATQRDGKNVASWRPACRNVMLPARITNVGIYPEDKADIQQSYEYTCERSPYVPGQCASQEMKGNADQQVRRNEYQGDHHRWRRAQRKKICYRKHRKPSKRTRLLEQARTWTGHLS